MDESKSMTLLEHQHHHGPNRFAVIPTAERLKASPHYSGKGVRLAFLDSGFYPHPDLVAAGGRDVIYHDVTRDKVDLQSTQPESWRWHGTQTSVSAAGDGWLSDGVYRGLASDADLVLVKVSEKGRISEDNIARGLEWVVAHKDRYNIRILNMSLGGDEDVPCSRSIIDQAAEEAIKQGIVVVVAAGNSDGQHSIPPANSPSVITVGGYNDGNKLGHEDLDLYHSNYGVTVDGTVKPEVIAPAMWVAAPILPHTSLYQTAEALSLLAHAPDYKLLAIFAEVRESLPPSFMSEPLDALRLRALVEATLQESKIVAAHYQHVDGTSFAAPIVSSVVAQMLEANPRLSPATVKNILVSTAERIGTAPVLRQGYGVINAARAVAIARDEQHVADSTALAAPRITQGKIRFAYHNDEARSVSLAGEFNNWQAEATRFVRDESGTWIAEVATPRAGRYEYKFLIDGRRWIEDPSNGIKEPDNFGGLNSVLVIQ